MFRVFSALLSPSFAIFFSLTWLALVNAVSDMEKNAEHTIRSAMMTMYTIVIGSMGSLALR